MKKKEINITLPQPCQEEWDNMSETERGRFCKRCQKEVIDFARMNDAQILKFANENKHSCCGSFSPSQLNRPIVAPQKPSSFTYKKIAAGVLALLSFETIHAQSSQKLNEKKMIVPSGKTDDKRITTPPIDFTISGDVTLQVDKKELSNVTIKIGNDPKVYTPDSSGYFSITLNEDKIGTYTIISFEHPLLKREVRSIFKTGFPVILKVYLEFPPTGRMGGMPVFQ